MEREEKNRERLKEKSEKQREVEREERGIELNGRE